MYATDVRQHHRLMPPGRGIISGFVQDINLQFADNTRVLLDTDSNAGFISLLSQIVPSLYVAEPEV